MEYSGSTVSDGAPALQLREGGAVGPRRFLPAAELTQPPALRTDCI